MRGWLADFFTANLTATDAEDGLRDVEVGDTKDKEGSLEAVQVPPMDFNTLAAKAFQTMAKSPCPSALRGQDTQHFLWKYFQTAHVWLWRQISL